LEWIAGGAQEALGMSVIDEQIAGFRTSALGEFRDRAPWELTGEAIPIVEQLLSRSDQSYKVSDNVAVHSTSIVESGAIIKAPAIIGPGCFVAAGAYLRGGCWLEANCIIGPGAELKSSFVFTGTKLAHFNFVGDSILGCEVNLEAGSIIANYRNEQDHPAISFVHNGRLIETGANKFGALVGDRTKIGANAVIAPGAILAPATIVSRLALVDQGKW
jgi:UDP-N-acetylglucosamine diphosphorylase / glucose-1-phosphate thymidylyltransferase / UDP-N-acetylgalactosamine diphosphorylase / glucosamine-1-phosphate N-acetyltransferase / galactosamine-1-phosphate N-acetyltransferase